MPKTILGQPIDETKWAEAKKQAAQQGHAGNYAYITFIYKKMAHLGKSITKLFIRVKQRNI